MKNISVATRIAIAIMFVAVAGVVVTFLLGLGSLDFLFRTGIEIRFEATRAGKIDELDRYLRSLEQETKQLAASPMTIDAVKRFAAAYEEIPRRDEAARQETIDTLVPFYRDVFLPQLVEATGEDVPLSSIIPTSDTAAYLQTAYFGEAAAIGVDPSSIDNARDGSEWSAVHTEVQPVYQELSDALGFDDILFIDAGSSTIVYSVAKEIDFATNLETGPGSGSTLATLVRRVLRDPQDGQVSIVDFARYTPDRASPMAFLAAPVFDGGTPVGVLVTKFSTAGINRVMTNDRDWAALGLGDSGETYVVGTDGRFRSDSRLYLEDPTTYFDEALATGTLNASDVRGVEAAGTTALFQRMDLATIDAATAAGGSVIESSNYLGTPVLTTLEPIDVDGLNWDVVLQVHEEEILGIIDGAGRASAVTITMFILLLTFVSVVWASRFVRPIRILTIRLRDLARGASTIDAADVDIDIDIDIEEAATTREFSTLAAGVEGMVAGLAERERQLDEAAAERRDLIRRFLPADIVRRLDAGDRDLVEFIPNATVVAIVIDGLGMLADDESADDVRRRLTDTIGSFDDLARNHGLERVKIVGDTYFAVCGLGRPYLDHAPRSVSFAREALEEFESARGEHEVLNTSVGIASGPIAAGLAGSHRLVYDAWGATVTEAALLARSGRPGTATVAKSVIDQLPESIEAKKRTAIPEVGEAWEITVPDAAGGTT